MGGKNIKGVLIWHLINLNAVALTERKLPQKLRQGGNTDIETRLAAVETKLAAVLAAKDTDSGKTLQIDSNGKVALVTV